MPDWFYRTVSRPLLFRLPAARGRDLALGFMGRLARLPLGPAVIDFPSPVGFGPALKARAVALLALAWFGLGFSGGRFGGSVHAGHERVPDMPARPHRGG